jgi:hypothetical protein
MRCERNWKPLQLFLLSKLKYFSTNINFSQIKLCMNIVYTLRISNGIAVVKIVVLVNTKSCWSLLIVIELYERTKIWKKQQKYSSFSQKSDKIHKVKFRWISLLSWTVPEKNTSIVHSRLNFMRWDGAQIIKINEIVVEHI